MDDFDTAAASFGKGAYGDAIRRFSLVPETSPLRGRALIGIGRAHYLLGHYQDAISSFDSAMPIAGTKVADAMMYKSIALAALGDLGEALRTMNEAMTIGPRTAEKLYNRGQIHMKRGCFPEAEKDFMAAYAAKPGDDRSLTYAALAAAEGGYLERAVDRCRGVISRSPQCAMALNVLSIAEARLGRLTDALLHSTLAIEIAPNEADYYYNRGCTLQALKENPRAIADFSRVIELQPEHPKALTNRGNCRLAIEDVTGAVADFSNAISLGDTISYFNRGNVHIRRGDMKAALADFDRSIKHHPNHVDSYIARSLVNRELGREPDSIRDYEAAMRIIRTARTSKVGPS